MEVLMTSVTQDAAAQQVALIGLTAALYARALSKAARWREYRRRSEPDAWFTPEPRRPCRPPRRMEP